MKLRKIAATAGIAAGTALAFAPLASADIDFDAINASQIDSLNASFQLGAFFTGVPSTAYTENAGGFLALTQAGIDTYAPPDAEAGDVTPFLNYIYGVDPVEAGISSGTGSYNVMNGAMIQFSDAYNASLFNLFNPGETPTSDIFIGSATNVANALATDNPATYFYNFAIGDLSGYYQTDLSFLQIPVDEAGNIDFTDILSSQVEQLNNSFNFAADLAGLSDKVIDGTGPLGFDTILTADTNDLFNSLIFGFSGTDGAVTGSFNVLNGALTQFSDAYNVGLYALLSGGQLVPVDNYADYLFGAESSIMDAIGEGATVSSAISDFTTNGINDLLGFLLPDLGSLIPSM